MKKWIVMAAVLLFLAPTGSAPGASPGDSPAAPPGETLGDSPVSPPGVSPVAPAGAAPAADSPNGRRDYRSKCATCHGSNALMTVKTARRLGVDPRKLSLMASKMSKDEMIAITEKGKEKMPGFESVLTKEQIAGIVDYLVDYRARRIKSETIIRVKPSPSPNPAPAETPVKKEEAAP
jgi:mono/diheme cytochrome c family protein